MPENKKPTIYDVAKMASCSPATVSLTLKKSPKIKAETQKRVMAACKQLNFVPNYFGKGLITQKTNTIGVIIPNMNNPIFSQMVEGIEEYANEKGYGIFLSISNMDKEKEIQSLDLLNTKKADGLIIFPTYSASLVETIENREQDCKKIVICGTPLISDKISCVYCDSHLGGYFAVRHLIERGRRNIALLIPVVNTQQSDERLAGYREALEEEGIPFREDMIIQCLPNNADIYQAVSLFLQNQRPDAMFCLYDFSAIAAQKAIINKGLAVPEDIALIGYDNIEIISYLDRPISTIETHSRAVGRRAASILVDNLEGKCTDVLREVFMPELVIRKTT